MKRQITINSKYKYLQDFITHIPESFSTQGEIIYEGRNEIRVFQEGDLRINVKRYKIPFFLNRIVYALFRSPKATRAYNYAMRLREMDINTPEPIACICFKKYGLLDICYFISIQVPYSRNFYEFGHIPVKGHENIIRDFAYFTAQLHKASVYHQDYSPGNILFDCIDGKSEFCIVDINRLSFCPVNMKKGCANFARLWGQRPFFQLVAKEYASARNYDGNICYQLILKYRQQFWKRFTRKHPPKFELDL